MDRYELMRDLGSGNFGSAKLMRDKNTRELLAVKYIERGVKIDENVQREIINHRLLRHPNIVRFKEVLLTPTHLAIAMEYAAGGELFERISTAGRFTEDEARYFFQQLVSGVSYCHSMQICHRDLKLENTLLDGSPAPRLKICDFGYSKISDVWSCGVTLYVMLVGAYPFEDPDDPRNVRKIIDRVRNVCYSIPDYVRISSECRDLLSHIFVADPKKRITIFEITNHPWFLKNLPSDISLGAFADYDLNHPPQSLDEIMQIIQEAKISERQLVANAGDPALEADDMEVENDPDADIYGSDDFLCAV
ncbi:hypothetical protein O6H91_Y234700 [Diphasiastrum complanatum]|nr:hypothetical protein O6H91_Y234700 [Diphasiastrum complanatum]